MCDKKMKLLAFCITAGLLAFSSPSASAPGIVEEIELNSLSNIYGPVDFDHAMHMEIGSCATCHHHTTGTDLPDEKEEVKCAACHRESCTDCGIACGDCHAGSPATIEKVRDLPDTRIYHFDKTGLKRAYHVTCLGCHREMEAPVGCEDCHRKKADL